jgi:GNAT superfamily N-acetyltransferase
MTNLADLSDRLFIRAYTVKELVGNKADLGQYADPNGFLSSHHEAGLQLLAENPHGQEDDLALVVAVHGETIIGRLAFYGGVVHYGGQDERVLWLSGFFMVDSYRSSGAGGLVLLRALETRHSLLASGGPSERLQTVYKRTGFVPLGPLRRFVYFYRSRVLAERFVRNPILSRVLSMCAQPPLQAYYAVRSLSGRGDLDCRSIQRFGSGFEGIFANERRNFFPKSAAQLNWVLNHRNPFAFDILRDGSPIGYCLLQIIENKGGGPDRLPTMTIGTLLDYYLPEGAADSKRSLVHFCLDFFRKQRVDVFECQIFDRVMETACARLGMIHLGGNKVFFRPRPGKKLDPAAPWFLPLGTSDVILREPGLPVGGRSVADCQCR